MKKFKYTCAVLGVVLFSVCILTGSGVFSQWAYLGPVKPQNTNSSITINWETYNAFPPTKEGQDLQNLVNNAVDGNSGMNGPANSTINKEINDRISEGHDNMGSMDIGSKDALKKEFGLDQTGISFIITFPKNDPNTRYMYSTNVPLGTSGVLFGKPKPTVPNGEYIYVVYKSTLKLNTATNKWETIATEKGYASPAIYQNSGFGSFLEKSPAFDPNTWKKGELGHSKNDAIYTFTGQTTTAYLKNPSDKIYYKVQSSSKKTININITQAETCGVRILDANMSPIALTSGQQGGKQVSWQAQQNQVYYLEFTGNKEIAFSVS